ncbi:MAG: hypothetical protein ABIH92_02690 [Nanoarchaeota archaeon]
MSIIKLVSFVVALFLIIFIFISITSAGIGDWFKGITGKATNPVDLNITAGVPQIIHVFNDSMTDVAGGLNSGPSSTSIVINFSVYSPSGAGNLNHSTAKVNFTRSGEDLRQNLSCINIQSSGDYANYSCNVTMWWWDGAGAWDITAFIEDNDTNSAQNTTTDFTVGSTTGFDLSPSALTWPGIAAGTYNITPDGPILMNNTGNQGIGITTGNITVNATNLRGESDPTKALWAGNFSIGVSTGGSPPAECSGSTMNAGVYTNVSSATLPADNYTVNDGSTGQEQLYFCLKVVGSEITTQSYSTANESSWTIQAL